MEEMKKSKLLSKLIEDAKKIGEKKNSPFTAERFVVAILDYMNLSVTNVAGQDVDSELLVLANVMNGLFNDLIATKEYLMEYICQEDSKSFLDDLYMKKKMQKAYTIVKKTNDELTTLELLLCIIEEPTKPIEKVLFMSEKASNKNEEKADVVAKLESKFDECFGAEQNSSNDNNAGENSAEKKDVDEVEKNNDTKNVKSEIAELVEDVKRIRAELKSSVYGQDNAINVFVTGYFQANMMSMIDKEKKRPQATFLFAGPPGVGKTFLAEKIAESLKLPFMRFDMSEYADHEANLEFCGADKVYKYAKPGNVTSFVADNPKCVLLFDEVEKAHMCVIHLFLQMLDAGRLRDNYTDNVVSFSDAIIILTTNAGKPLYEESESGDFSAVSRKVVMKALQNDVDQHSGVPLFPAAICSRLASGNVVMFNRIGAHNLRNIAKKEIERHAANLEKETGIKLKIDERVYSAILFSQGITADARTIRSRAEAFFNDELYELLRLIATDKVSTSVKDIEYINIGVDLNNTAERICGLFESTNKTKVLVFANGNTVTVCKESVPEFEFISVQNVDEAIGIIKSQDIDFVLLDMKCGETTELSANLNIEDVDSSARTFFKFMKSQGKGLPVYLIDERETALTEEEKISFMRQGVREVLQLTEAKDDFAENLKEIASNLHQQTSMMQLARENKLVSFETAQTISEDGKDALIKLFDFEMVVAVESEDAKNILSAVSKPDVRFDDVIGAKEAKKELEYFVKYLENPKKYLGTGVKAPKGVVLYGPPGTGKTMLAKAMACEAGVTFIATEGNSFLKKYVGEGAQKVHDLFRIARKYAPSILFIDEIDAIGKERRGGAKAVNGEETLTALLTEMDGFANDPSKPVFVLAATNFDVEPGSDKSLDPALMRRFDRRVYIDLPNKDDRIEFLEMKIAKNPAIDISKAQIDNIAIRTTGMSLADLDSVIELALRSAIREECTKVNDSILEDALETFNGGEVKKWDISQLERVARHEAGHAFLCWLSGDTPTYLTVVARGNHGGYMQHIEQEGKKIYTKDELLADIRTALGGRASEIAYYGERDGVSTGAGGDLASATNIAYHIVCTYGMDEDFGLSVVSGTATDNGIMSVEVRSSVNRILREQMDEAVKLVSMNKDVIDSLVEELMTKNHLNSVEIEQAITKIKSREQILSDK